MANAGILFTSNKNYLKASSADTQVVSMSKPSTYDSASLTYYSTITVNHNLGYIPLVRAWYSPNNDNYRFPAVGFYNGNGTPSDLYYNGKVPFDCGIYEITTTQVTFRTLRTASLTGSFNLYYKIYLDPTT